jgi:hypothetical protein
MFLQISGLGGVPKFSANPICVERSWRLAVSLRLCRADYALRKTPSVQKHRPR